MMNRKELKKAYEEKMIDLKEYALKLVDIDNRPREKRKETRIYEALTEEEFAKLLEKGLDHNSKGKLTKPAITHFLCFILAYGAGLRISEVVKLTPDNINLTENRIFVRQAKGSKDRVVNVPKWLEKEHLKYFPVKIGKRAIEKVFLSASIRAGINAVLYTDKAGRPRYRFHFHSLRHSFSVRALEKGVPIHHLQILLGHENIATTNRYTKANPKDAIQSIIDRGV